MRKRFYEQTYKTDAGVIEKHYVWSDELETAVHIAADGTKLTYYHAYEESLGQAPNVIIPMNANHIKADRRNRATEHFKKEVYPTVNKKDQKYFAKKHGLKT